MAGRDAQANFVPPVIPEIELLGQIAAGADAVVFRGRCRSGECAVKVWRATTNGDHHDRSLFEAAVLARARHPALPRVMEVGAVDGQTYLVMEHVAGGTLAARLTRGPLPEGALVEVSSCLAGALAELHRLGLVHRDVKPANVLIGEGGVKLVDLGLATDAQDAPAKTDMAVGTFLYSPPEQTGMLSRPIDGRSDLYSLGVTMWECAAGHPPFQGDDAAELVRRHLVAPVPDLRREAPEISAALAAVIAKLMSKDPDDRYHSAASLQRDLEHLAELDATLAAGGTLLLDRATPGERVEVAAFVGRVEELGRLRDAIAASRAGNGIVALVEGLPGSGKSRIAREALREAREAGDLVLCGKCVSGSPMPLGPLREAVERHLRQLRRLEPGPRAKRERALRAAAASAGPLLRPFSTMLADFVGAVGDGDPPEDHEPFYENVAELLVGLADAAGGTVLFVDDAQWADEATLRVLTRLAPRLRRRPFMLLLAARNDSTSAPALQRLVDALGRSLSTRAALDPLGGAAVRELAVHLLGDGDVDPEFIDYVSARSDGNPFAVVESVRAALGQGLLRVSWGRWALDRKRLVSVPLPENVVELVVRRMELLGHAARDVLTVAAVLGGRFDPAHLIAAAGVEPGQVYSVISAAIAGQILERGEGELYNFLHDRLREALLAQLDETQRRALHERVARALDGGGVTDDERLFALARHYALAAHPDLVRRAYEVNLEAGLRAMHNHADEETIEFLAAAARGTGEAGVADDPRLYGSLGDAYARRGRVELARGCLTRALDASSDATVRARLRIRLAEVAFSSYDAPQARKHMRQAYAELGKKPLDTRPGQVVKTVARWLVGLVLVHVPWLRRLANTRDRGPVVALNMLYQLEAYTGFFEHRHGLLVLAVLSSFYLAHSLGPSRELAHAYASYGFLLGLRRRRASAAYLRRAIAIGESLGDPVGVARSRALSTMAKNRAGAALDVERLADRELYAIERWLETHDFYNVCGDIIQNLYLRGYAREAVSWFERTLTRLEDGDLGRHPYPYSPCPALAILGRYTEAARYCQLGRELLRERNVKWNRAAVAFHEMCYQYELEDEAAVEAAFADWNALGLHPGRVSYQGAVFVYATYLRLGQLTRAVPAERAQRGELVQIERRRLRRAASVPALRCHLSVADAVIAGLAGRARRSEALFLRAETEARLADSPWGLYEAWRWRAHLARRRGDRAATKLAAQTARATALEHGWLGRVRHIERAFGLEATNDSPNPGAITRPLSPSPPRDEPSPSGRGGGGSADVRIKRHLDALLRVSLHSTTILDPVRQARATLDEIVRLFGAERAFLFLRDEASGELLPLVGRDLRQNDVPAFAGFSGTIVRRVADEGGAVILGGTGRGPAPATASAAVHGLRSIMAAPLLLGNRLIGVVYLDTRVAHGLFDDADVEILLAIAGHIAIAVEAARTAHLELEREALERDLALTTTVQSFFVPRKSTASTPEITIAGHYRQAVRGGGNWWWYDLEPGGRAVVFVGDVSGRGPAAAMVTVAAATAVRTLQRIGHAGDVPALLETASSMLVGLGDGEYCMTMSVVVVDPKVSSLQWWSAGAPPVLLQRPGGDLEWLSTRGAPLGSRDHAGAVQLVEAELPPGSRVLMFTEGLLEVRRGDGRPTNLRRVAAVLGGLARLPVVDAERRLVRELLADAGLQEDVTLVLLERQG